MLDDWCPVSDGDLLVPWHPSEHQNTSLEHDVDLSVDALTYKADDVKTFTNEVTLEGDLNSEQFVTKNQLEFNSDELVSFGDLSHTGTL